MVSWTSHPQPSPHPWLTLLGRVAVAVLLGLGAAAVLIGIVSALVWWRSPDFVYGIVAGVGLTVIAVRRQVGRRTRHLRELVDWLGEDLEARKAAEIRRLSGGGNLP